MTPPRNAEGQRAHAAPHDEVAITATATVTPMVPAVGDIDALTESLYGVFVCQVVVDDVGHRRTNYYRNLGAVERAVDRARNRGRTAHVSLVQLVPVGTIVGVVR